MDQNILPSSEERNLYATLLVSPSVLFKVFAHAKQQASAEEIKNAYRRLCVLFHPDKHVDAKAKESARIIFQRVQYAYSVLSNPQLREVHDRLGFEGLEMAWQVGTYLDADLKKIIEEIERLKAEKVRFPMKTKAVISPSVNATMLTEDLSEIESQLSWTDYVPGVDALSLSQQIQGPISENTNFGATFGVAAKNGSGKLSITSHLSRYFPKTQLQGQLNLGLGSNKYLSASLGRPLTKSMYTPDNYVPLRRFLRNVNIACMATFFGGSLFPSYHLALTHLLGTRHSITGTLTGGSSSSISMDFQRFVESSPGVLSLKFEGDSRFDISGKTTIDLDSRHAFKTKVSSGSLYGAQISFGLVQKNEANKISCFVEVGSLFGVSVKTCYSFRDYNLAIPVYLFRDLSPSSVLFGVALPTIVGLLAHNLIIEPYKRYQKKRMWETLRVQRKAQLALKREEAEMASILLEPISKRRCQLETVANGLIITNAVYQSTSHPETAWDVTVVLQAMVHDSQLVLPPTSKVDILGFYDVSPGEDKILRVEYLFRGKRHLSVTEDARELLIPLQSHLIER